MTTLEGTTTVPVVYAALEPGEDPEAFEKKCAVHADHHPLPLYLEEHHVIPRAWQAAWAPSNTTAGSDGIWDPRTEPLCRTGHGNVHFWIEAAMSRYAEHAGRESHSEAAIERAMSAAREAHGAPVGDEHLVALEGMRRFHQAGGKLLDLANAGILGGIYGRGASTPTDG